MSRSRCFMGSVLALSFLATSFAAAQYQAPPPDPCAPVHAAYNKMLSTPHKNVETNSGAVNVTKALGAITSDGSFDDTCKYLRDESTGGEPTAVYSEIFKSRAGEANGVMWVSKRTGIVLRQDVDVDMGAQSKGHQSIRFDYGKK
jgi:hypothetical protein